ncbi:CBM96 family carbohydrate-binding protein [Curtobacterium flaccumfaciens]|uniref:CBM96 family carbohydrate-binding protein n=1 Tax=Curtobacterium flaccumfaciens TaxID=2035 RepID=UPI003F7DFF30
MRFPSRLITVTAVAIAMLAGGLSVNAVAQADTALPAFSLVDSPAHPRVVATAADLNTAVAALQKDDVGVSWSKDVEAQATSLLGSAAPRYSLKTGDLLPVSRDVLNRVYLFGYMYRTTGDRRWSDAAWSVLDAASRFPDWNPDHFLDTAEMAHAFGVGYDWMYPAWTPAQRSTLSGTVQQLAFRPAIAQYQDGADWVDTTGNWNVVVNSGLGTAAIALGTDAGPSSQDIMDRVLRSLPSGLRAYADDGGYAEGVTYWGYATGYLTTFITSLPRASDTSTALRASPGLAKTGTWATAMSGPSGALFNFGDAYTSEAITDPLLGLERIYDDASLRSRSVVPSGDSRNTPSPRALIWLGQTVSHSASTSGLALDRISRNSGTAALRSSWDDSNASYVGLRDGSLDRAVHSDMDQGSIVFDALGVNWFTDLGADDYGLPGYFDVDSGQRWAFYRKRMEGQNTVVVNPSTSGGSNLRGTGKGASLVRTDAETGSVVADLSGVQDGLSSWKRGVQLFDGRKQLLVQDEVVPRGTVDFWSFLHTKAQVVVAKDGGSATLTQSGRSLLVRLVAGPGTLGVMKAQPLWTSPQSNSADDSGTSALVIHTSVSKASTFALQITPLPDTASVPDRVSVMPISSWSGTKGVPKAKGLAADGVPLSGFRPDVLSYVVQASTKAVAPAISATVPSGFSVSTRQASAVPGRATVTVRGSDGVSTAYTVDFIRGAIPIRSVSAGGATVPALIDGDVYSAWHGSGGESFIGDLGRSQRLSHLEMYWSATTAKGTPIRIETSDDRAQWRQVYVGVTSTVGLFQWASFNTGPVTARYFRVSVGSGTARAPFGLGAVRALPDQEAEWPTTQSRPLPAASLTISNPSLEIGTSRATRATFASGTGTSIAPTGISYTSSAPSIASVSADGVVRAVRVGTANIAVRTTVDGAFVFTVLPIKVVNPAKKTLPAVKTAHVHGGGSNDTTSFGAMDVMYVRHTAEWPQYDRYAYIGFDLAGVDRSRVQSATLRFDGGLEAGAVVSSVALDAHSVSNSWTSTGITFANRPAFGERIGSTTVGRGSAPRSIDLTAAVKSSAQNGFAIGITQDASPPKLDDIVAIRAIGSDAPPTLEITYG